jgi:pimeloyl-ACP methyl ester carboxylesterase
MSSLILIHGGGHGSWCWGPIIDQLRSAGHDLQAVDLPGRDGSLAGGSDVTFEDWLSCVSTAIDSAAQKPILVAHSMGGLTASQIAERHPDEIAGIVYVSAVVPLDGEAGLPTLQHAGRDCALLAEGAIVPSADGTTAIVAPEHARTAFYSESPEPDVRQALARLCAEALAPLMTRLQLGAGFRAVDKFYIGATKDKAVPPAFQRVMAERCGASYAPIAADHSPFYSAPKQFVAMLLEHLAQ